MCLGLKPRVAGWKVQTNPLSYGGTPKPIPSNLCAEIIVGFQMQFFIVAIRLFFLITLIVIYF